MFWWLALATCWRLTPVAKKCVFGKSGSVFKPFQFSLELFMTIHFLSQLKLIQTLRVTLYKLHYCLQTPFLHLFTSKSSRKRYGFLFPHLISRVLSFIFVNICVGILFFLLLWVCFDVFRIVLVWIVDVLFLCELVSIDRFMYYPVLVFLR